MVAQDVEKAKESLNESLARILSKRKKFFAPASSEPQQPISSDQAATTSIDPSSVPFDDTIVNPFKLDIQTMIKSAQERGPFSV